MAPPREISVVKKMQFAKGKLKEASEMLNRLHTAGTITKETHSELLIECQEINQYVIEMVLFIKACQTTQKAG